MWIGKELEGIAIEIKTAVEIRKALAIVLVPDDRPLRQKMRRVRIPDVVRHGPRQELTLGVELHRPASDGRLIYRRCYREWLLRRRGHAAQQRNREKPYATSSSCHIAPPVEWKSARLPRQLKPNHSAAHRTTLPPARRRKRERDTEKWTPLLRQGAA